MQTAQSAPAVPPGTTVVTMPAEVEYDNAGVTGAALAAALASGATTVIADFSTTTFCDTAGIREITIAHRAAQARGICFRLAVPRPLTRIFTTMGLDHVFTIYPSLAAALAAPPVPRP